MQHFILPGYELKGANELQITDKELLHQMKTVLRFRAGSECIVLDGYGAKAHGEILELHKKGAVIALKDYEVLEAPKRRLRLYAALSKKPSTFEMIVQKATELGATDIIPLVTKRCQISELRKAERIEHIIREACEQSERAYLPKLHKALKLEDLLEDKPKGMILAGDPWTYDLPLSEVKLGEEAVNVIIGPEGGLVEEELQAIRHAGGTLFVLGPGVLRMETAVIAALSLIQYG